jgi:hypothetical protein
MNDRGRHCMLPEPHAGRFRSEPWPTAPRPVVWFSQQNTPFIEEMAFELPMPSSKVSAVNGQVSEVSSSARSA